MTGSLDMGHDAETPAARSISRTLETPMSEQTAARANLISYKQAAERLAVPIGTLRVMVSRKQVPHVRLGKRIVKFDPVKLDHWIDQHRVEP